MRESGIEPEAIIALLARLGTADPVDATLDPDQLAAAFDLSRFGRPRRGLTRRNSIASTPGDPSPAIRARSRASAARDDEATWLAIRPNLDRVPKPPTGAGYQRPIAAPEVDAKPAIF